MSDIKEPSAIALRELNDPTYLRNCDVRGVTTIRDGAITYDVLVGNWFVWSREGIFGQDVAHRAGGAAFVALAREQEQVMHAWADKVLEARQ